MRFPGPVLSQTGVGRVAGPHAPPISVALVPWGEDEARTTVVVKATYLRQAGLPFATEAPSLGREQRAGRPGSFEGELGRPDELVQVKRATDVLLVGHAHAASPSERIEVRVRIEDVLDLAFGATSPNAATAIALVGERLCDVDGGRPFAPVGAIRARYVPPEDDDFDTLSPEERRAAFAELLEQLNALETPSDRDAASEATAPTANPRRGPPTWEDLPRAAPTFEKGGASFAAAHLVVPFLRGDERLHLEGLQPGGGSCELALPGHEPVVVVDGAAGRYVVEMLLDTLVLDDDTLSLTWRGQAPEDLFATPVCHVALSMCHLDARPSLALFEGELSRATHGRATLDADALLPPPPVPDLELELAHLAFRGRTPLPWLDKPNFDEVRRLLRSRPTERVAILEQAGFDEQAWALEERAWRAAELRSAGTNEIGESA